jgi:hypothetical protein
MKTVSWITIASRTPFLLLCHVNRIQQIGGVVERLAPQVQQDLMQEQPIQLEPLEQREHLEPPIPQVQQEALEQQEQRVQLELQESQVAMDIRTIQEMH